MPDAAAIPLPASFAGVAARARAVAGSPAIQRARPALLVTAALLGVLLLFVALRSPDWRPLHPGLSDADTAAVADALAGSNFAHRINPDTGAAEVASSEIAAARIMLAGQGLPKAARGGDALADMPLGASRSVESARLKAALASELAASVEAIDGVKSARVHVATPEPSVFIRDRAPPSASVFVSLAAGRTLSEAQVRAIVWLVSTSVAGLAPDKVSVVDQTGTLLSASIGGDAQQLGYQARLEGLVRERLVKMLTPLIGAGKFTAEVAADVDFSQNEASSERFQPAGTLKSEQASRSIDTPPAPARGIPGALSNTAPQAAQISATPPAAPASLPAPGNVTAEQTSRMWEIGKEVSVTRGAAPRVRRLSVAVVIDLAALGKNGARDLPNLVRIVRGAVGYDAARGDIVEVQMRGFAPVADDASGGWLDTPAAQNYGPYAVGGAAVLVIAGAAVLVMRRRKRAAAAAAAALTAAIPEPSAWTGAVAGSVPGSGPLDGGTLTPAGAPKIVDYREKLGQARDLVTGDGDRAIAVARQMLLADKPPAAPGEALA